MLAVLCRGSVRPTCASPIASLFLRTTVPQYFSRGLPRKPGMAGLAATSGRNTSAESGLEYPEPLVFQPLNDHKSTLIMLPGLGDTGMGWADIGPLLQPDLPHTRFVFPTAPTRSITLNNGMRMPGWYDIADLNRLGAGQDEESMRESSRYVEHLVQQEVDGGIPSTSVAVGGFSQGGAMSLLMLRSRHRLAGVASLSGYLPMHEQGPLASEANRATPVLMCHGDCDQVVHFKYGEASYELLKEAGLAVEFQAYEFMGHEACPEELQSLRDFLQRCFASAEGGSAAAQ